MPAANWAKFGGEGKPLAYICGKLEQSPETPGADGVHIQGWAQFNIRMRLTAILKLFPSSCYHWEPCAGTEAHNQKYCKKTKTQIGAFECKGTFTVQGKTKAIETIEKMVRDGASMRDLWRCKEPGVFACLTTRHRGIKESIEALRDVQAAPARFTIDQFGWEPVKWGEQTKNGDVSLTWVLAGPAGIGKTQFAKAHFKNPLMISDFDDLGRFQAGVHDGLIFDDCDDIMHAKPRTIQTAILEQVDDKSIRIRYGLAFIPGGTKKMWTTNDPLGHIFNQQPEVQRRHKVRILEAVDHPVGAAVVPNVSAASSSSAPVRDDDGSEDGLDDEEPGSLVRANAAYRFDVPSPIRSEPEEEDSDGFTPMSSQVD